MAYQFYDIQVGLYQGDRLLGSAYYFVKARNYDEAKRKAVKQAEEHRNPQVYGSTFSLRVVNEGGLF